MDAVLAAVRRASAAIGGLARAAAWLILVLVVVVNASVLAAALGIHEIANWGVGVPLFGERLTQTAMGELQWHLFSVIVMFGGVQAFREDEHVRVDFLYRALPGRARMLVDLAGHVVFLLPFLAIIIKSSIPTVLLAYRSGAGSDYGGLVDRFLVKAVLPIGFSLLLLLATLKTVELMLRLLRGDQDYGAGEA